MKKKLMQLLLLVAIVFLNVLFVAPIEGQYEFIKTDVAAQTSTTKLHIQQKHYLLYTECDSIKYKEIIQSTEKSNENKWETGWTTTNVNVRSAPDSKADIYTVYNFNKKIKYITYNRNWVKIKYGNNIAFINKKYISNTKQQFRICSVPENNGFKSYMPYTAITSRNSLQYKLQLQAYTGKYGIRMVNNRYCVAIGTAFNTKVGTYFDIVLKNKTVIPCVVADIKANKDTDSNNMITVSNGCLTEFIVDFSALNRKAKLMGNVSYCNNNWNDKIDYLVIYDRNILKEK